MLKPKDEKNLKHINQLLEICKTPILCKHIQDHIPIGTSALRAKCEELVEMGYLDKSIQKDGFYQNKNVVYVTINPIFDIRDYSKLIANRKAYTDKIKAAPTKRKRPEKKIEHVVEVKTYTEPSLADNIYKHNMDRHREKYHQQAKDIHSDRKSPRVFVSGNSEFV
jgi:hypothetical protein